jgi:CDP-glucose 4,6-dehydratase
LESLGMMDAFWRGKKVLLTGHTGFKGSWLALWLQHLGADVSGYALAPPTDPCLFDVARVGAGMTSIHGDVNDYQRLKKCLDELRPEIVIHLAAQSLVRYSYSSPVETYATNVMGTVHLMEAVRCGSSVKAVLCVTTDKCYENKEWPWGYREIDPMGGHDPYSSSKGCAELVVSSMRRSFFPPELYSEHGVAVATARAGNVIGGGDWAQDRLVPDALKAFSVGDPVVLRSPAATRPWQHVLEPLGGYLQLAQCLYEQAGDYAESWNFGPKDDDVQPVSWIVERLASYWGGDVSWVADTYPQPHEAGYLKLDCSKAAERLRWRPRMNLSQALEWCVDWHRDYLAGKDIRSSTYAQIEKYMRLR